MMMMNRRWKNQQQQQQQQQQSEKQDDKNHTNDNNNSNNKQQFVGEVEKNTTTTTPTTTTTRSKIPIMSMTMKRNKLTNNNNNNNNNDNTSNTTNLRRRRRRIGTKQNQSELTLDTCYSYEENNNNNHYYFNNSNDNNGIIKTTSSIVKNGNEPNNKSSKTKSSSSSSLSSTTHQSWEISLFYPSERSVLEVSSLAPTTTITSVSTTTKADDDDTSGTFWEYLQQQQQQLPKQQIQNISSSNQRLDQMVVQFICILLLSLSILFHRPSFLVYGILLLCIYKMVLVENQWMVHYSNTNNHHSSWKTIQLSKRSFQSLQQQQQSQTISSSSSSHSYILAFLTYILRQLSAKPIVSYLIAFLCYHGNSIIQLILKRIIDIISSINNNNNNMIVTTIFRNILDSWIIIPWKKKEKQQRQQDSISSCNQCTDNDIDIVGAVSVSDHDRFQQQEQEYKNKSCLDKDGGSSITLFWLSLPAKWIYMNISIAILFQCSYLLHGTSILILYKMYVICYQWFVYHCNIPQNIIAVNILRNYIHQFQHVTEKCFIQGTYTHQVAFGIVYKEINEIKSGKHFSILLAIVRYIMGIINYQTVLEMEELRDKFKRMSMKGINKQINK